MVGKSDGLSDFTENSTQIGIAYSGSSAQALAATLLVVGTDSVPGGQILVGGEMTHVRVDLS